MWLSLVRKCPSLAPTPPSLHQPDAIARELAYFGSLAPLLAQVLSGTSGFYLPGVAPHEYQEGEKVEIRVHKLSSPKTHLPYDYYSLPFCEPPGGKIRVAENLGEVLHGSIIQNSPYEILMGKSEFRVCCLSKLTRAKKTNLVAKVKKDYRIHMIMDNLPAATKMIAEMPDGTKKDMYDRGFRLGFIGSNDIPGTDPGVAYVNNHLRFIVKYHKSDTFTGARIVGFEVEAYSVKYTYARRACPTRVAARRGTSAVASLLL